MTQYDIIVTVAGGGLSGQAGAVRHGIAKALTYYEPELRPALKKEGFLTRDSRVVERKKYGHKQGARAASSSRSAKRFLPLGSCGQGGLRAALFCLARATMSACRCRNFAPNIVKRTDGLGEATRALTGGKQK